MNKNLLPLCDCKSIESCPAMHITDTDDNITCSECEHYLFWGTEDDLPSKKNKFKHPNAHSQETINKVKEYYHDIKSITEIEKLSNIPRTTIYQWAKKFNWTKRHQEDQEFSREFIEEVEDKYYETFNFTKTGEYYGLDRKLISDWADEYKWVVKKFDKEYKKYARKLYKKHRCYRKVVNELKKYKPYYALRETVKKWCVDLDIETLDDNLSLDYRERNEKIKNLYFKGVTKKEICKQLDIKMNSVNHAIWKYGWRELRMKNAVNDFKIYPKEKVLTKYNISEPTLYKWRKQVNEA